MKKIMHTMFLSCLRATELVEKKIHFGLSAKERLQLKMHKMMCDACTSYEKQSIFLEKGISVDEKMEFSPDELKNLKLAINEKLSEIQD
jgi:hypothetical protein